MKIPARPPRLDVCGNPLPRGVSFASATSAVKSQLAQKESASALVDKGTGSAKAMRAQVQRLMSAVWIPGALLPEHPFPSLEWHDVKPVPAIVCSVVLFIGAVLCSAGGIGGGGVYVTVLMVAGQLSPHDAVPLSKAVVFTGSLASLVLNLRKALTMQQDDSKQTFIDYNVTRLVVPCSLLGTLLGVMINSMIAPWLIVSMLIVILLGMTYMSSRKFITQYTEESSRLDNFASQGNPQDDIGSESRSQMVSHMQRKDHQEGSIRAVMVGGEGVGAFLLLCLVIACGVFRQHAENCRGDIDKGTLDLLGNNSCARPIMNFFFGGALCSWMAAPVTSQLLPMLAVIAPACTCAALTCGYGSYLVKHEGWMASEVLAFGTMALFTGCFAGLVGIGGGLVFSPFMLWMGLDSAIAVATSSTCVIFTSSSTTIQYLLTDRIIMSLTIVYGLCSTLASCLGTKLAHLLQEKYHARPSFITGIVCLGVIVSVILSVVKLCTIGIGH